MVILIVISPCCSKGMLTAAKIKLHLDSVKIECMIQKKTMGTGFRMFGDLLKEKGITEDTVRKEKQPVIVVEGFGLAYCAFNVEKDLERIKKEIEDAIKAKK